MKYLKKITFIAFDGEEEEKQEEKQEEKKEEKMFSQEEVNAFLAKDRRKTTEAQKALAHQLESAKKSASLTSEERVELEKEIEALRSQYMTVEEQNRHASEKAEKKHKENIDELSADREIWQTRYTQSTIESAIINAAIENKAISPAQLSAMLKPQTKLVEKQDDDGKATGNFECRLDFADTDKKGEPVTLNLTIPEAIKRMSELENFGNLFSGGKSGGLGASGGTNSKGGKVDLAKIARTDPAQYRKLRKEQPELFNDM